MSLAVFGRVLAVSLVLCCAPALAQPATATTYEPSIGQAGKDVVWIPTSLSLANKMLDMAKVTPNDYVIDLGSGDGRTVITAAKRGARALGIEYNPDLVELSKRNAEREGVSARAKFVKADIFESDFSQATVITLFLLPHLNERLRPQILALKPGTRIVSNSFDMGDWEADERASVESNVCENSWCNALLWIVPATVAGTHKIRQGELTLEQRYQVLTGTLRTKTGTVPVQGKVMGEEVEVIAGDLKLRGKVVGKQLKFS
jgi:SAM-dependent methyltransferase